MACEAGSVRDGQPAMMSLVDWVRCRLIGACPPRDSETDRRRLEELKERTRRAERQTAVLRHARLTGEPRRADALDDLWGPPPWRDGSQRRD